jgi:hypothetical protein
VHHTLAWFENIAAAALNDLTPVPDGIVAIQNAHFIFEEDHRLLYAYVGATNIDRARWVTPKFRQTGNPFIRPLNLSPTPLDIMRVANYLDDNLVFRQREELALEARQEAGAGQDVFAVAGFQWGPMIPRPGGEVLKIRFDSVTAAVVETWTQLVATLGDPLPWGTYAIVGLEHRSANAVACRMILENTFPRPGALSTVLTSNRQDPMFSDGSLGVYGQFHSTRLPIFEVFCDVANAVHEVYLDIVRIG